MGSSFSRIANEPFEDIPQPPGPLEIDSGIANKLRDLVRGAHEQKLASLQRGEPGFWLAIEWLRTMTIDLLSPSPTQLEESTPAILARAPLYEKLQYILTVPSTWGHVISLGSNDAGAVLDLLQEWLDWAPVEHSDRRRAIYLLVKLSIGSKQLPRLLYVSNVQMIGNRDPFNGGGFADVFKASHNDTPVVLKRLRVYPDQESISDLDQNFRHEALIWRQLKHPFILPLIGIDATTFAETHRLPCLVSPFMRRGTLKEYIRSKDYAPTRDFYRLLQEAAQGLAYLHTQKVIHGDIKDVNILIDEECHVQLCDFGLVVVGSTTDGRLPTSHGARGTVTWMSPQRLGDTLHRRNEADDVYSFACLCYYLSTGHAPFHEIKNQNAAVLKIINAQRPSRPTDGDICGTLVSDALWAMVESCWAQDAFIRPTAAAVVSQLAAMAADVLSEDLIEHLETRICNGVAVQTALDILDRALLDSDPSHPAYRQGVRRLRRWCRKFALLPTSSKSISSRTIQLQPEHPRYTTALSDVFYGLYDGSRVAVKVLRVYDSEHSLDDDQKRFRNAVAHWRYLRHPNIVPFVGVCDKSPSCFVSYWMEEGTLLEYFKRHPGERRTSYMLGAIRGLAFMHSLGVVHGDIKASNILVDREHRARLSDFGMVSVLSNYTTAITDSSGGGAEGTVRYMAPELYLYNAVRTDRSDIYALSITIWEIFTLNLPFSHIRDTFGLFLRVAKGDERPINPVGCENIGFTDDLWDMMQRGWSAQPESRSSLSAFIELLESQV